ncbi:MAG: tetratricopeptide repeat protein [Planctomycetota bacterium]
MRLFGFCLAAIMLASAGCSSLRYKKTEDLWVESDQKFKAGQYGDAVPYYDELLRRDDSDVRARQYRGIAKDRSGATTEALDDYQRCSEQGSVKTLLWRANLDIKSGFLDAAERDLQALRGATLENHEQVAQFTLIGTLRLKQGNARMAVQSLEKSCELARGQSDSFTLGHARDAHYNAAYAYYQLGEFQSGMEHMEQYRQISETTGAGLDGRDYSMLTLLHYLSGDIEGARGYVGKADPEWRKKAAQDFGDPAFFGS